MEQLRSVIILEFRWIQNFFFFIILFCYVVTFCYVVVIEIWVRSYERRRSVINYSKEMVSWRRIRGNTSCKESNFVS